MNCEDNYQQMTDFSLATGNDHAVAHRRKEAAGAAEFAHTEPNAELGLETIDRDQEIDRAFHVMQTVREIVGEKDMGSQHGFEPKLHLHRQRKLPWEFAVTEEGFVGLGEVVGTEPRGTGKQKGQKTAAALC